MRAETWWNKALSPINPQVVYALNQSSHPLLFLSQQQPTHWGDLLALSYGVKSSVRFRIQALPEDIEVPDGYTDVFWFDPLTEHQEKLNRDSPYNVEMVVPGRLWRVVRKMR
jgi:hypothetical protein